MRSCEILLLGVAIFCLPPGHARSVLGETKSQQFPFQFTTMCPSFDKSGESQITNIDSLYELINKEEYASALTLTKLLLQLQLKFTEDGIKSVVQRMLRDGNERIMKYAYILKKGWSDENIIINCFPNAFQAILSGKQARILTKDRTGVLVLSTDRDPWQDRRLHTESAHTHHTNGEDLWFFREPQFKCVSDDHYLEIRNQHHRMNIKLDVNTQNQDSSRLAWGDERPYDERYKWKIIPAGMDENDEPLFCFVDKVYKHILKPISSANIHNQLSGFKKPCDPNMAWIIEPH